MAIVAGKIDVPAFEAEVAKLVGDSEAYAAIKAAVKSVSLNPKDFFATLPALLKLGDLVVAAVQVVKTELAPEGGFDKAVAIDTAAKVLDKLVEFQGSLGWVLEQIDGFLIKLFLSALVYGRNMAFGHDWLAEAKELLGIA